MGGWDICGGVHISACLPDRLPAVLPSCPFACAILALNPTPVPVNICATGWSPPPPPPAGRRNARTGNNETAAAERRRGARPLCADSGHMAAPERGRRVGDTELEAP